MALHTAAPDGTDDAIGLMTGVALEQAFPEKAMLQLPIIDGKCLNFLHIPKNAGTAIERAKYVCNGAKMGMQFGFFDKWECENGNKMACEGKGWHCNAWHVPPGWDAGVGKKYEECDTTFCIIRDPASKFLSEYMYENRRCDAAEFETFVEQKISLLKKFPGSKDCHFVPQSEFTGQIVGGVGEHCQRPLRHENLTAELDAFLSEFNITVDLQKSMPRDRNYKKCELTMSQATSDWIKDFYADDYANLGYNINLKLSVSHESFDDSDESHA